MKNEEFAELWVDKYRPTKIDDIVLNEGTRQLFKNAIKSGALTSCTFIGVQGSGKTTLAKILANEFNADTLFIPCATEGGIDTLRSKVKPFTESYSDKLKIVILDELDSASAAQDSSFQKGLRNLIEMSPDTRFICTANYDKIIPAVLSRCPVVDIRFAPVNVLKRLVAIFKLEHVEYSKDDLVKILDIVNAKFPDIRSTITTIQRLVNNGKFDFSHGVPTIVSDGKSTMVQIVDEVKSKHALNVIRTHYIQQLGKTADYVNFAGNMFVYLLENDIVSNAVALQQLANEIYKLNVVVDKEIGFFAFVCAFYAIINKALS